VTDDPLEAECDLEFFTAGGPGGQHRNKTESAVRVTHRPTGIVVAATERRSQHQNRAEAFERLREKLAARLVRRKPRKKTRPTKGSQTRRIEAKKRRGTTKSGRKSGGGDE